jgi:hypothetical protein
VLLAAALICALAQLLSLAGLSVDLDRIGFGKPRTPALTARTVVGQLVHHLPEGLDGHRPGPGSFEDQERHFQMGRGPVPRASSVTPGSNSGENSPDNMPHG